MRKILIPIIVLPFAGLCDFLLFLRAEIFGGE